MYDRLHRSRRCMYSQKIHLCSRKSHVDRNRLGVSHTRQNLEQKTKSK